MTENKMTRVLERSIIVFVGRCVAVLLINQPKSNIESNTSPRLPMYARSYGPMHIFLTSRAHLNRSLIDMRIDLATIEQYPI